MFMLGFKALRWSGGPSEAAPCGGRTALGVAGAALLALGLFALPARAQVSVEATLDEVTIENTGAGKVHLTRSAGKASGTWMVYDNVGNGYPVGWGFSTLEDDSTLTIFGGGSGGGSEEDESAIIIIGGYQSGGEVSPEVVAGYRQIRDVLQQQYGAVVTYDPVLEADLISFPKETDPIGRFFEIITREALDGQPYHTYFRMLEVAGQGVFDPQAAVRAESAGEPLARPNDAFLQNQWNLGWSRLADAHWHPARARKAIRIGVIDSGIGVGQRTHEGLDGTDVRHEAVAPTTGEPVAHGLNVLSLLTDRAHDGSGIVGVLGAAWTAGSDGRRSLLASRPPEVISYGVGDFGPISLYVARAIRQSIDDGVDILNLGLALPYSPTVEAAIQDALAQGILVVAAAGNYTVDAAEKPAKWPANMEGVIAVGAAGEGLGFSPFSARTGVDVLAPGEDLVVGGPDNGWHIASGTSFAAPHVTAALALMRAVRPDLSSEEALEALRVRAWAKDRSGGIGFLNALSSLNHVLPPQDRARTVAFPYDAAPQTFGDLWAVAYDSELDNDLFEQPDEPALAGPARLTLLGNFPNPFTDETTVRLYLPEEQRVRLTVYNVLGQEVQVLVDGPLRSGYHDVSFRAADLPSGIYLSRLETASGVVSQTMTLMR